MQKFGYEALVINRIDENFKKQMQQTADLEFMWEGADLGAQRAILTHVLYAHYDMPPVINPKDDKECWKKGNADFCAKKLVKLIRERAGAYKSDKIMLLYGDDFLYNDLDSARSLLERMERIIHSINTTAFELTSCNP
jgi:hypothetical protein